MPMAGYGMFQGTLTNSGQEMAGDWIQGGQRIPTTFTRADVAGYRPIPDNEPEITARVRSLKMEELRAEDCTPEFWRQLQQSRQSENPEFAKAVATALGQLRTLTLVERAEYHGTPSYLYRMEYQNMNVLFRIIFDGKKIAYANGYPEPK
jgi:hypothetical protein